MKLVLRAFQLPLKHTFTIAYDSRDVQETLVVELTDGLHHGFGEATTNPYYGATLKSMAGALESVRGTIENMAFTTPENLWEALRPSLSAHPFAQCALDMAAHDWYGKHMGQPLHRLWGLPLQNLPLTNYTIGIDSVMKMVEKLKETPWPLYKIKLGTADDVAIVRELRRHTDAVFRVDANCAWTPEQTVRNALELQALGVEFVEQPLPAADWDGMKHVHARSVLPLVADESCIAEADVARCAGFFHGVNVKLVKCGGLTPARRMLAEARRLGLRTMVGCMTESTVGISAIAHLLPLLDYADMDGALLLRQDIASGVRIEYGRIHYGPGNGTGAELMAASQTTISQDASA